MEQKKASRRIYNRDMRPGCDKSSSMDVAFRRRENIGGCDPPERKGTDASYL